MDPSTLTSNNPQSSSSTGYDDPVVAEQAKNLTKAIFQHESGTDYNVVGDAGTSRGAGQWQPETWKAQAQDVLGDPNAPMTPENQSVVAQGTIRKLIKSGKNAAEIAAIWNSGSDQGWQDKVGTTTINGKQIAYNVPKYVKDVTDLYQQYKNQNQGQSQASDQPGGPSVAQASTGTSPSDASKVPNYAGAIGNFLFPIAGDLYNDATGKNTGSNQKSVLQQVGDAGLSALPFIPGLGEAGEGLRGAGAAVEGAGALADAAKGTGLLSKVAASPLARNAAVGYGAGVAQNLSQGKGIGESVSPNLNTVGGGILGAGGSLVSKALGGILDKASGIAENTKPILSNLSDPKLYSEYEQVAAKRAQNIANPSILEHAADHAEVAVKGIQSNLGNVGKQINELKTTEGSKPLAPVAPVMQQFQKDLEDKFGLKIYSSPTGAKITIEKAPGRMKNVLSPADQNRVKSALKQLITLNKNGNVRKASDVLDNLDGLVDYSKKDLLGNSNDPLESFLKSTRHNLNEVVKKSSPALGAAKTRAYELNNALETIKGAGGSNLQRAELLLKRVFSGDQSSKSREVFNLIKKETGVDLTEHAVLAKHFIDHMGDQSEKSALQKMLEESAKGGGPTIPGLLLNGGKAALNATIANPIRQGQRIVEGKPGLINSIAKNRFGVLTKGLLGSGRGISNLAQ